MVSFDDFKKIELRVATIKEVKDHPDADKLYVLIIEVGGFTKQLVAGIKSQYKKEELINRQIVIVDNLAPAVIRGIESQGMLLAASDKDKIAVLIPDKPLPSGSIIK